MLPLERAVPVVGARRRRSGASVEDPEAQRTILPDVVAGVAPMAPPKFIGPLSFTWGPLQTQLAHEGLLVHRMVRVVPVTCAIPVNVMREGTVLIRLAYNPERG